MSALIAASPIPRPGRFPDSCSAQTFIGIAPRRQRLRDAAAISLALHALLLALIDAPSMSATGAIALRTLQVILPPTPPAAHAPPAPDQPAARPAPASPALRPAAPQAQRVPIIPALPSAVPPAPTLDAADSTRMNIESARDAARAFARDTASPSFFNARNRSTAFVIPRPEAEAAQAPIARAVVRATNANCREKYAGAGLLGLPFLIKDQFSDSGCIW